MADKKYDNTNRFSLWSRDKGPVKFTGFINVDGTEYSLKFMRLAGESAKAYVVVEDKDNYVAVGAGPLYPSKFDDVFLSGKINVKGKDYYLNVYKNDKGGEKSPVFSGKVKAADGTKSTKSSAPEQESDNDDW